MCHGPPRQGEALLREHAGNGDDRNQQSGGRCPGVIPKVRNRVHAERSFKKKGQPKLPWLTCDDAARAFSLHVLTSHWNEGWLFLKKKPLRCVDSAKTRSENAVEVEDRPAAAQTTTAPRPGARRRWEGRAYSFAVRSISVVCLAIYKSRQREAFITQRRGQPEDL